METVHNAETNQVEVESMYEINPETPQEQRLNAQQGTAIVKAEPITVQHANVAPVANTEQTDPHQLAKVERIRTISKFLESAYAGSSLVPISKEESKELRQPFPDHTVRTGARGKDNLLYIEHAALSDRLTDVLGMGQWSLIRRTERYDHKANTIYADCVLVIRGAVASEAIGENDYNPTNRIMGFSDALKAAESNALSRCCQRLGIGSQVWDKGYCEQWLAKYDAKHRPERPSATTQVAEPVAPAKAPTKAKAEPKKKMSYFAYNEEHPYVVPGALHEGIDAVTENPFQNSPDHGKPWSKYAEEIKLEAAWSYCHDIIERDKDNPEKNVSLFVAVLKGVSSELVMRGHQPHALFE